MALRLSTRNRGAIIDDSFVYLWLYQFDGQQLRRVFDMAADQISAPRGCDGACDLPSRSQAVLLIQPGAGHHGLRDLRQRQKTWTVGPGGKPVGGAPRWNDQLYVFDGVKYQAKN
ncbi:MAG: hypothetical protein CFE46_00810 [Burkholderiales bacterium PBB6]|nr:MAG: hypothetical protein CFE46_00810 [Burkholderiales bacterium PBB6]